MVLDPGSEIQENMESISMYLSGMGKLNCLVLVHGSEIQANIVYIKGNTVCVKL